MATEHEHFFIWFHGRYECEECCRSKEAIELEQQLAQAREESIHLRAENFKQEAQLRFERQENERMLAQRVEVWQENEHLKAQNAAMRALLAEVVQVIDSGYVLTVQAKIRAFLAQEATDGKNQ